MSADGVNRVTRDHRAYRQWQLQCDDYYVRAAALVTNKNKLFTVTLMQCSPSVKLKLQASSGYTFAKSTSDCKWLMTNLKNVCHKFEQSEHRFQALWDAKVAALTCKQGPQQSVTEYFETFRELLSVLESYGGANTRQTVRGPTVRKHCRPRNRRRPRKLHAQSLRSPRIHQERRQATLRAAPTRPRKRLHAWKRRVPHVTR